MNDIHIKVNGSFVEKDEKIAGVQGEGNSTVVHIELSEEWKSYSKRIIWRNAKGENAVSILLYNSVEDVIDGTKNPLEFATYVPSEALTDAGWCSFTIEGFKEATPNSVAITATDYLEVLFNDSYYSPAEPTPSQAQQLQVQIDQIIPQVTEVLEAASESFNETANELSVWEVWSASKIYRPLNKVSRGGSSYICKVTCQGIDPVSDVVNGEEGTYWILISAKGDIGPQGPKGAEGKNGSAGPRGETGPRGEQGEQGVQGIQGPPGPQGVSGTVVPIQDMYAFSVDDEGYLWLYYEGDEAPAFSLSEDGDLLYTIS